MEVQAEKYVKPRLTISLDDDIQHIISLISYKNDKPQILGSSALASQFFSSDYDLFERVYESNDINKAKKDIYNVFRNMMRLLKRDRNILFMDFKCGYDDLLFLKDEAFKYPAVVRRFYKERFKSRLITKEQMKRIDELVNDGDRDFLYEYCSKLWKIRWTPDTIEKGYTILSNNRQKTFEDCLDDKTVVKIDVVSFINGNFIEFSNIFELHAGKRVINVADSNIVKSIKRDIRFYYKKGKWYKVLKRVFSIAKLEKDLKLIKKLTILFNSNTGLVNRVRANMATIYDILDKGYKPVEEIKQSLQYNKNLLGYVYQFSIHPSIFEKLDKLTMNISKDGLKELEELLDEIVNTNTKVYMDKYKINIKPYILKEQDE